MNQPVCIAVDAKNVLFAAAKFVACISFDVRLVPSGDALGDDMKIEPEVHPCP